MNEDIVDTARFVNKSRDAADFDAFVKRFDYNAFSRIALPLLIQSRIRGIGFALACDLLKELGYTNYPKPDVCDNQNYYDFFDTTININAVVSRHVEIWD